MSDGISDSASYAQRVFVVWKQREIQSFLSKLTKKELVDEICRRDGVAVIDCPISCRAKIQKGDGKYSEVSFGKARILVVGE